MTDIPENPHGFTEAPEASIIVPTLDEVENVEPLCQRLVSVLQKHQLHAEILIVDGGSQDGTRAKVQELTSKMANLRLVPSAAKQGLAGDVLRGAAEAASKVVLVMDADLSHPPEKVPQLLQPVIQGQQDMVLGSRYVSGGATPGWPWLRRLASRGATACAWPLVQVNDPMSGFFAVQRHELLQLGQDAGGFKIALELLVRGEDSMRVQEVPITFRDRELGESKLGLKEMLAYFKQLVSLSGGSVSRSSSAGFACVGLVGLLLDVAVFNLLLALSAGVTVAHVVSFSAATLCNYSLNARFSFAASARNSEEPGWQRYGRYLGVCLLALCLRGAVLSSLVQGAQWPPQLAIFAGIAVATLVNYIGAAFFIFPQPSARAARSVHWRLFALAVTGYVVVLRLAFAGIIDLVPQEARHWFYAQHLPADIMSHPLVSWLVLGSNQLLGQHEFVVRLPAALCWGLASFFVFRLAMVFSQKTSACLSLVFMAVVPFYFGSGLLMTPAAALHAAWAGGLYFLARMLFAPQSRRAWLGLGLCLGLGLLAHSAMLSFIPAILLLSLGPQQKLSMTTVVQSGAAVLGGIAVYSALTLLQGLQPFAWLTLWNLGSLVAGMVLISAFMLLKVPAKGPGPVNQGIFPWVMSSMPLLFGASQAWGPAEAQFMALSGVICMVWLPFWAKGLQQMPAGLNTLDGYIGRHWKTACIAVVLCYGVGMYYMLLGLPGLTPLSRMVAPVAWEEMATDIEAIENRVELQTSQNTYVLGVEANAIASVHAFYDPEKPRHFSGDRDTFFLDHFHRLPYKWQGSVSPHGSNMLMVSFDRQALKTPVLLHEFARLSRIRKKAVHKDGQLYAYFYYRVGYRYTGASST